ncbi:hypothetical protein [Mesorhizobium sp. M0847]|uniref:hypothetical protein n=1 Tax=unclassified Mesorhizobium TaxID=325217 RepID=UPI003335D240
MFSSSSAPVSWEAKTVRKTLAAAKQLAAPAPYARQFAEVENGAIGEAVADSEIEAQDLSVLVEFQLLVGRLGSPRDHIKVALAKLLDGFRLVLKPYHLLIGNRRIDGLQNGKLRFGAGRADSPGLFPLWTRRRNVLDRLQT